MARKKNIIIENEKTYIDLLEERNAEIKEKLSPYLQVMLEEKERNMMLKKPLPIKFGYRLGTQLDTILRSYGLMDIDEIACINYDIIYDNFTKYNELMSWLNMYFEINSTKQFFCAFMRITTNTYNMLETNSDNDIKNIMQYINDSIIGLGFCCAESGNSESKSILSRLKIKNSGQDLVENTADISVSTTSEVETPKMLSATLNKLLLTIQKK